MKPLATKTEAIINFKQPENIIELHSFNGKAQQVGKFSSQLAQVSLSMRDLLSTWTNTHTAAFNEVKEILSTPKTYQSYAKTYKAKS